ncbi:MAG: hypothetical protein NVSMB21_10830 [Vulcanimicrobiaceae bacterium]
MPLRRAVAAGLACCALGSASPARAAYAAPKTSREVTVARERARGNDKPEAARIGRALLQTIWPVQITKIRVDVVGAHRVAGLVLSGSKFHEPVTPDGVTDEVVSLVERTFAASTVEEVDVWVTLPLPTYAHEVVAGDLARPTFTTVYAATVRRGEREFAARIRRGEDVYWLASWRATLAAR